MSDLVMGQAHGRADAAMGREDLNDALAVLVRASETNRAIITTYFVIYTVICLFSATIIFPQEQERLDGLLSDMQNSENCVLDIEKNPQINDDRCKTVKQ